MGHPRVGVCPEKIKSKIKTKTKTKIKSNGSGQECPLYRGELPAPLPLLGRCTGLRFAAGGRGILPLRKERAKMGHPGAGVRLKKIKTKIKSKTKTKTKIKSNGSGQECPLYTGESADAL